MKKKKVLNACFLTGCLVAAILITQMFKGTDRVQLKPLGDLPIPVLPTVKKVAPVTINDSTDTVLGAEIIDPRDLLTYINGERMKRDIPPLRSTPKLMEAAKRRAEVIMKYENFSHWDKNEGIELATVLPSVNYPFTYATENIGMGAQSARSFMEGFMASPSHRANLLDPSLRETGAYVATGPWRGHFFSVAVQLFAIPSSSDYFLGYTKTDIKRYEESLNDIVDQLSLTRAFIEQNMDRRTYVEGWQKILIRQKEILTTLLEPMKSGKPFIEGFVTLIKEYNTNWKISPPPGVQGRI